MGGNALSAQSKRIHKSVFCDIEQSFESEKSAIGFKLSDYCERWKTLLSYKNKETFGDMDIIVGGSFHDWEQFINCLKESKQVKEVVKNGSCVSVGINWKNDNNDLCQVDFIYAGLTYNEFNNSLVYGNYNVLGNLCGRVAHKQGFKYGHDGLWYKLRNPNNSQHVVADIKVSDTNEEVFDFMGYDYDTWLGGFETLEDIFVFAASSPYFNKDIYALENRNHVSRVRDRKRKTYTEFLKWIEDDTNLPKFDWSDKETLRKAFLEKAFLTFPGFKSQYDDALEKLRKYEVVSSKFNGTLVGTWTGLEGKELGHFMAHVKTLATEEYLLVASPIEIENFVKNRFTNYHKE